LNIDIPPRSPFSFSNFNGYCLVAYSTVETGRPKILDFGSLARLKKSWFRFYRVFTVFLRAPWRGLALLRVVGSRIPDLWVSHSDRIA
jgi:hypothetical protein